MLRDNAGFQYIGMSSLCYLFLLMIGLEQPVFGAAIIAVIIGGIIWLLLCVHWTVIRRYYHFPRLLLVNVVAIAMCIIVGFIAKLIDVTHYEQLFHFGGAMLVHFIIYMVMRKIYID